MNPAVRKVFLVIADISGYTRFMTSTKTNLLHSQIVISELTKSILTAVKLPLSVSKLEGDAVFMYAIKEGPAWEEGRTRLAGQLLGFFDSFTERLVELVDSNMCSCAACAGVEKLKLKLIVHSGDAVFQDIGGFSELAGVDVITVHRLLKNSVDSQEYILMTEACCEDLQLPEGFETIEGMEQCKDIGPVNVRVWLADEADRRRAKVRQLHRFTGFWPRWKNEILKIRKVLMFKIRPGAIPRFNNLLVDVPSSPDCD
jgi:hypothetical protein